MATESLRAGEKEIQAVPIAIAPRRALGWRRRVRANPVIVASMAVVAVVVVGALFPGQIAPYDPIYNSPMDRLLPPGSVSERWAVYHILGTDNLGRDVFSRLIWGAQVSMQVAIIATAFGTLLGTIAGFISAYAAGRTDLWVQRAIETLQPIPALLLAMVLVAAFGQGLLNVMLAVGFTQFPIANRVVRSAVMTAKEELYVEAARCIGATTWRIAAHHIMPNVVAPVIVLCTTGMAAAILVEGSLSFLGFGVPAPLPSWGGMTNQARQFAFSNPVLIVWPSVAISVTVLAFNFLGDWLRDVLDPKLRGSR